MRLKSLAIRQAYTWETKLTAVQYGGTVEFENDGGKVEINLSDDLSRKILAVVADELVETSKLVANMVVQDMIEASGLALQGPEIEKEG